VDIRFLQPFWLLLLLILPLLWFWPRRLTDRLQGVLRTALAVLLVVALARPVLLSSDETTYRVFVIDRSESMSAEQRRQAQAQLKTLQLSVPDGDPVSVIAVGAEANPDDTAVATLSGASTSSLGAALQSAATQIPEGSRGMVTLIGDGLATDRQWGPALQDLVARGIPVNTVYIEPQQEDLYPAALHTDPVLRVGQTVQAVVDVIGAGSGFTVQLIGPDGELATSGELLSEGRISVPLSFEAPAAEFFPVTVQVTAPEGEDTDPANNRLTRTLAFQDPLKLLYVGERQQGGADKLAELLGRGFDVTDAAGETLDENLSLDAYDLVMLDDQPAKGLPASFQHQLVEAVRQQGLGLLFAGGKASFGSGGYHNTLVAQALPVEIAQREEKRDPSVSLAIIIDTSGSMSGPPLELAKQVAQLTIHRLTPDDKVGIVEFYGAKQWAVPLQSAANRLEIDRAIGRMQAGGGTVLYPGIEEAYYGLKNMHTRFKHILVITDAGVEDADFEGMVRRIAKDGITLSSVLVGDGRYDEVMFNLASWGKGRYYAVADRYSLVELILKQLSTTQLPSYRTGQFPLVSRGGAGWWGAVNRSELPPLNAYVEADLRPRAEVLIEESGRAQPVLATWQYGLGRVTSLMTEPFGAGTRTWQRWPDRQPHCLG
jgi:Mg-chelatase subunit ChlD